MRLRASLRSPRSLFTCAELLTDFAANRLRRLTASDGRVKNSPAAAWLQSKNDRALLPWRTFTALIWRMGTKTTFICDCCLRETDNTRRILRENAPQGETDSLSALGGVQSRSGLGARVPFRWPRPETGKISLVRFPRIVRLSPSLRETNAFGFKWFRISLRATHKIEERSSRLGSRRAGSCRPVPFVSRGTTYSRARSLAEKDSNGRET